jgi:hypothetical protein
LNGGLLERRLCARHQRLVTRVQTGEQLRVGRSCAGLRDGGHVNQASALNYPCRAIPLGHDFLAPGLVWLVCPIKRPSRAVFYVSEISDVIRHFEHSNSPTIQPRVLSKMAVTKSIGLGSQYK